MAALVAAIHVVNRGKQIVDGRNKSGHDVAPVVSPQTNGESELASILLAE
jgi:hypothetical protein